MKTPEPPAPESKSGPKIDYVAKRLALALAPLGFTRKARRFTRAGGTGDEAHWQIVQLQADQWNEGPRGAFFVNLSVQFPALMRLAAQRPGMQWLEQQLDDVDERLGQLRQRLGALQAELPSAHPCARPAHSDAFKFGRDTDLAALADGVVQATCDLGLPWLQQHASLRHLADFDGALLIADVDMRIGAAVLLGDRARAQQILVERRARFEQANAPYLAGMRAWLAGLGLDVSMLRTEPEPARTDSWAQKRQAEQRAEEARHAQRAGDIRAQAAQPVRTTSPDTAAAVAAAQAPGMALPHDALAEAWVAEHRAGWRSSPAPLTDLPSGRDVAALDAAGREAVLCALLQQLVVREDRQAGPRDPVMPPQVSFDLDESVRVLTAALLPTLPTASEATALGVLRRMRLLVSRWQRELVTGGYPWGFAPLVRWLSGPACAPHRAALKPAIVAWLDAFSAFAVAEHTQLVARVQADQAAAEDPAHPLHEALKEAREREAELAARQPPPSDDELRRRIAEYPEQCLSGADKLAVATLRREVRRDAATGSLPVAWDGDDWGQAAQAAWQALPEALRQAVAPVLQGWLEGVDTRPGKTWLRTLQVQIAQLPAPHAGPWRTWVLQQLAAFQHGSGRTEWATTGARPGVGARLGEASENLLLGLLWWAWHDGALEPAALHPALQAVAAGAWQRLPEVGARAPSVGGLVLRMSAGLDDTARQAVAALAGARGAPRQLKQAVERALDDPLQR